MKLSIKEKLGYSFGEFAGSSLWQTMMFFLPVFYTDVFLLLFYNLKDSKLTEIEQELNARREKSI
ncbi:MAG: hypothetical protein ABFS10_07845 [Bacteroidota bacterium]